MTIQSIKDLDFYKCSLQDINAAYAALSNLLQRLINRGDATACNWLGTPEYREVSKLFTLVARAKSCMDPEGYMLKRNINKDRLPNSQSVL